MRSQKHKRKAAVSRKVVERILPPIYKVSRLRACLVRVRVRMVLYALFYEKDIPN
jgi:hypothetical protein